MSSRPDERNSPPVPLTEGQRRHLTVFLEQLEEALHELERMTGAPPSAPRRLLIEQPDLSADFGPAIRSDVGLIRAQIEALSEHLRIRPRVRSRAAVVRALLGKCIVDLADAGSRGLRGYGRVDPRVVSEVDPVLRAMEQALVRIAGQLDARL